MRLFKFLPLRLANMHVSFIRKLPGTKPYLYQNFTLVKAIYALKAVALQIFYDRVKAGQNYAVSS